MKPIIAHRTTIDAERQFDLWLTFVGHPTVLMNRHVVTASPAPEPSEAEIQRAAYFIWLEDGRPAGRELEHWLAAKALLAQRPAQAKPAKTSKRRRDPFPAVPAALGRLHHN